MPVYARERADEIRVVDEFENGVGWLAHPDEAGRRVSHAIETDDGVWLFDPLDAPGVDALLAEVGAVTGVAVLSDYHARDAATLARRHDVPVSLPAGVDRPVDRIDAPIERVDRIAGFELRHLNPLRSWHETVAYRERDGTLYVPDFLTAVPDFCVGEERVAMNTLSRFSPPFDTFDDIQPARILFGHGTGVFEEATPALRSAFDGARRRFPRALVSTFPGELRLMLGALR